MVTLRVAPGLLQVNTSVAAAVPSKRVPSRRSTVKGISRRSRNRFWTTMAKIDWRSAVNPSETLAFVTLTYPRCWRKFCCSPKRLAAHLDSLVKRFEREVGVKFRAVWVREFQSRGAPHLHLVLVWPCSLLTAWIDAAWYEVVGSLDQRHRANGVKVELFKSVDSETLQRVSRYLMKQAHGMTAYQPPPADWCNEGGGIGRCWGRRGLQLSVSDVQVPLGIAVVVQRLLRRLYRSRRDTVQVRVKRYVRSTGEVTWRSVRRRKRLRSLEDLSSGFSFFAEDGPALAVQLARLLEVQSLPEWQRGRRRPIP